MQISITLSNLVILQLVSSSHGTQRISCFSDHFKQFLQGINYASLLGQEEDLTLNLMEEMDWDSSIHVENFMRANGIEVTRTPGFGCCEIEIAGTKAQGRLSVSLSLTRRDAVDLLHGLGVPVLDVMAG